MSLEYWYMLPIAIVVATTAMASGIGGATMFAPIFIIGLRLSPDVAIGTGLLAEVFGFTSGLYAYSRKRLIDYKLGLQLLLLTIPAALVGTYVSEQADPNILKAVLGVGLFAIALSFLRAPSHDAIQMMEDAIAHDFPPDKAKTVLVTADGETIHYTVCNRNEGRAIGAIGGLFVGMISTGLGELNGYFLLQRCRVPSKVAVATSVFVVAFTALSASIGHLAQFVNAGGDTLDTVFSVAIFTIPGVVIGAQFGSILAARIPQKALERSLGMLFILIAAVTLGEVMLG